MNLKKIAVMSGVALTLTALPALAGKSSVELGKQLFNDPSLGSSTNDKSCNSCHPGGEGLEKAASLKDLSKTINLCVTGPMAGKKLDGRGVEMRSLKMYIESLGGK
jgi:cytochrome c peroxidase